MHRGKKYNKKEENQIWWTTDSETRNLNCMRAF